MLNQAPTTSSYETRYEDSPDEAIRILHQQRYEDYHSTTQQLCSLINKQSAYVWRAASVIQWEINKITEIHKWRS